MKKLVAWSTGFDSTKVLYDLLKNTDDEIVAFRMDLGAVKFKQKGVTFKKIATAESIVAPKAHEWLMNNLREFPVIVVKVTKMDPQGFISLAMVNAAADIARNVHFDSFVYSRSLENDLSKNRLRWLRSLWNDAAGIPMETPLIKSRQGRPHAMATLPKDLQAMMFSCDDPRQFKDSIEGCAKCVKCKVTAIITEMLDNKIDPDVIFDYCLKKMAVGPYLGSLSADPELARGSRTWIDYPKESL